MPSTNPPTRADLEAGGVGFVGDPDVSALAARFRSFQALTHGFVIDNPMGSTTLDRVIDALDPRDGDRAIDIPCGRGELLTRLTEHADVHPVGVDISPWVIRDALDRAAERSASLNLFLGDGKAFDRRPEWDIACSVGGSWIWNGTRGTIRALSELSRPGARVAIGDVLLRPGAPLGRLQREGRPTTRNDLHALMEGVGITPRLEIVSSTAEWEAYTTQAAAFAALFLETDPGLRAAHTELAEEWAAEFERDRHHFDWVVIVGEKS